jgi:O-antigen ligase
MPSLISERFHKKIIFLMPAFFLFWHSGADIVASTIAVLFLLHSGKTHEWIWVKKPWFIAALALWVYATFISSPLAVYPETSFKVAFLFIRFILFGAGLAYWILQDKELLKWFEYGVIAVVLFIVLDCFIQAFVGVDIFGHVKFSSRLTGPFTDKVPGTYVTKLIFIAFACLFYSKKLQSSNAKTIFLLIAMVVTALFMFLTGERSPMLNYLLGCTVIIFGLFFLYPKMRFGLLSGFIAIILAIGIISVVNPTMRQRSITSSYEYIADWPNSDNGIIVLTALDIWLHTPNTNIYTGIGLRNFRQIINDPQSATIRKKNNMIGKWKNLYIFHPHNIYIEWLAGAGIIGLLGFILMTFFLMKEIIWKNFAHPKTAMPLFAFSVLLTTFWPLTHGMNFFTNKHATLIWLTVGWALAATTRNGDAKGQAE